MILEGDYYNEISKKVDNLQMMIHSKSGYQILSAIYKRHIQ